jgi:hypothetical protein
MYIPKGAVPAHQSSAGKPKRWVGILERLGIVLMVAFLSACALAVIIAVGRLILGDTSTNNRDDLPVVIFSYFWIGAVAIAIVVAALVGLFQLSIYIVCGPKDKRR